MTGQDVLRPLLLRPLATPAMHLLASYLRDLHTGRLHLQFTGHATLTLGSAAGPEATLIVRNPSALLRRVLMRGDIGFAESYIAAEWHTPDLPALLRLLERNRGQLRAPLACNPARWGIRLRHRLRCNNRSGSRRNIRAHYDLGNDFYSLWLDSTMSYSAALFSDPQSATCDDLTAAQHCKYERILDLIAARPGDRILEIGCGWGGFALAAARRGLQVTGITLSQEQLAYARTRVVQAGVQHLVELRLQDYRDLDQSFDHVVSIEMMEAVGEAYWETYFATLKRSVRPGGRIALQVITIDESRFDSYRTTPDFIQMHIFPGGMLPTQTALQRLSEQAGMVWQECERFGQHYARTCELWNARCLQQTSAIRSLGFDEQFLRRWHYYLSYCQAGFETGAIDLVQVALQRPG